MKCWTTLAISSMMASSRSCTPDICDGQLWFAGGSCARILRLVSKVEGRLHFGPIRSISSFPEDESRLPKKDLGHFLPRNPELCRTSLKQTCLS